MPLWPLPSQATRYQNQRAANTASLSAVNVPTGGSAHTKGAWTQLLASTAIDASILRLYLGGHNSTGVASPALLDIGVGGSGSEQVIVPNLDIGFHAAPLNLQLPCAIPAGSRVAARAQGARTAINIPTAADLDGDQGLAGSDIPSAAVWATYGVDTANSRGTSVTPGNSNAWGSWVQLGSATAQDHDYWLVMMDMGADTGVTSITYRVQLAVAANTTEAGALVTAGTLQGDVVWATNSAEYATYQTPFSPFARRAPTPAGANVYVRATASGTARTIYCAAYGGS